MLQMRFKKEGMRSYMIVECKNGLPEGYQNALLQHHAVDYFLQYEIREMDGKQSLYYRLSYHTTVKEVIGHLSFTLERLRNIAASIVGVMEMAEEYLLDVENIIWKSDKVFVEAETGKLRFCYCPVEEVEKGSVKDFLSELIQAVDKKEEKSILFILQFYDRITEPDCTLQKLKDYLKQKMPSEENREGVKQEKEKEEGNSFQNAWYPQNKNADYPEQMLLHHDREQRYQNQKAEYKNSEHINSDNGNPDYADFQEEYVIKETGENIKEKLVKIMLVITALINLGLLICLLLDILTYDYMRYLFISMGALIVLTILYMGVTKEESADEMMQSFFEEKEEMPDKKFDSFQDNRVVQKETVYMQETDFQRITAEQRDCIQEETLEKEEDAIKPTIYGETTVLSKEAGEENYKEKIVVEEQPKEWYLESMMKNKAEPVCISKNSIVIGSMPDGCNYVLEDRGISRMHAKITQKDGDVYLLDLNSTNGTCINGEMIDSGKEYRLEEGDMVTFARSEFYVRKM